MIKQPFLIKGGNDQSDIPRISIGKILFQTLNKYGNKEAFVDTDSDKSITYRDLVTKSARLALSLKRLGFKRNETIICISDLNFDFCVAYLACLYNGHTLCMLNADSTTFELEPLITDIKGRLILTCESALENVLSIKEKGLKLFTVVVLNPNSSRNISSLDDLIKDEIFENFEPDTFDPDQTKAAVLFSSGTTGLPKGAIFSHTNLRMVLLEISSKYSGTSEKDVLLTFSPVYHIAGTYMFLNFFAGLKLVKLSKFSPETYLSTIEKYGVTKIFLAPPLVNFLINSPIVQKYDLSTIKIVLIGSAPTSADSIAELRKRFPHFQITHGYGSTETSGCICMNRSSKNWTSVGHLLPNNEAKIIDIQTGEALGPNKFGELCIRGDSIITGYLDANISEQVFDKDGFLKTGDVAYYDEENYIYIVDRIKNIIKYKGFQISPSEIENVASLHPAVNGVGVFGLPDERAGELPCALIVKKPLANVTEKEIYDFVASRLHDHKHLRGGVLFVEEIPLNKNMKQNREAMRVIWNNSLKI